MCWTSTTAEVKTAKEDLVVFKMLIDTCHKRPNTLLSPIYRHFYHIGEEYRLQDPLKLLVNQWANKYLINEGIHSYTTDCCVVKQSDGSCIVKNQAGEIIGNYPYIGGSYDFVITSCIIPKGATYYVNFDGEVVSDVIKIIDKFKIG